ncbi:hypothetical protein [Longimicrobium sp.]|uniref:hypothetical protein n=1 Tax=Longimicrobium sp. TaxID=2029185 RepID=UPI002E33A414|nr:hypothetical protein [Longimicrobium sp.]HEX6038760.1 hypothetical protein [Longimicrobium sp.]
MRALARAGLFATVGHLGLSPVAVHQGAGRERGDGTGRIAGTLLALVGGITATGWAVALGDGCSRGTPGSAACIPPCWCWRSCSCPCCYGWRHC